MSRISEERILRAIQGRFNPIRGLKPQKLARVLDQYHAGYLREAALLWDAMENRDLLIRNVASKRKKAVARAQYEILTTDSSPEAMQQKEALEVFYNNLVATSVLNGNERGGMGLLVRQMMDAIGKGFAVHEIVWKPIDGPGVDRRQARTRSATRSAPLPAGGSLPEGPQVQTQFITAEFRFCPLWFFENRTGHLQYLEQDGDSLGIAMNEAEWLVTTGDAIMEATSVAYTFKHMAVKDWAAFCEKFGMPGVLGRSRSTQGSEEATELENAVAGLVNDWAAVLFGDDEITLLEVKNGGETPFKPQVEYWDRGIAAIWRGADLSTISQGQAGVGASLQGDESDLLTEDDSNLITETLWDQVDRFVLQYVIPGFAGAPKAYVKILPPKRQNVEQDLKIDAFLLGAGVPMSIDDVVERYGRPIPAEGDALLTNPAALAAQNGNGTDGTNGTNGGGRALENEDRARTKLLRAKRELLKPIFAELRRIDSLDGDEQRNGLLALQAQLPALKERLSNEAGAGDLADVLAEQMEQALIAGFKSKETR